MKKRKINEELENKNNVLLSPIDLDLISNNSSNLLLKNSINVNNNLYINPNVNINNIISSPINSKVTSKESNNTINKWYK